MTQRTVSIEAVALRDAARARHAEQDALVLQDDLLNARAEIRQLTAELEHVKAKLVEIEGPQDGATS